MPEKILYRFGIIWCALMLLSCAAAARGDEPPIIAVPKPAAPKPIEFKTAPGVSIKLSAGAEAKWALVGDFAQAEIIPCESGKNCTFIAPTAGYYYLTASVGDRSHSILVVVQKPDAPPEPMPPPRPPEPPKPLPVDPLIARLQSAYDADTRQLDKKRPDLLDLVELYGQAVLLTAKPEVRTVAALIAQIQSAAKALGLVGLVEVRRAIAAELALAFPADGPLDDAARTKASALMSRIQSCLKGISP